MDTAKNNILRGLRMASLLILAAGTALSASCDGREAVGADPHADHDHGPGAEAAGHEDDHEGHADGAAGHGDEDHEHGHAEESHDDHGHAEGHVDEVRLSGEAIERSGIRVAAAERVPLVDSITAPARVTFNEDRLAHVGSTLTGRVVELPITLGARVETGDVLFEIDSPELGRAQSELLAARTEVAAAEPGVEVARSALDRARGLYESTQGISLSEVQRLEAELRAAEAGLQAARARESSARDTLRVYGMTSEEVDRLVETARVDPRSVVRSPMAGEIVDRNISLGELVGPDADALLVVADLGEPWVIADVPEVQLRGVEVGTPAEITTAGGSTPIAGTVRYIAPVLDPHTRTARVRVVPEGAVHLRPGMFASVLLTPGAESGERVLAVPEEAVQTVEGRSVVFVPVDGEPNTFAARTIRHGRRVGRMVPVYEGLEEGDRFVVANSFILKADLGKSEAGHSH